MNDQSEPKGLRVLQQCNEERRVKFASLRAEIQKGIDDLEAGRYRNGDDVMKDFKSRFGKKDDAKV